MWLTDGGVSFLREVKLSTSHLKENSLFCLYTGEGKKIPFSSSYPYLHLLLLPLHLLNLTKTILVALVHMCLFSVPIGSSGISPVYMFIFHLIPPTDPPSIP